MGYPLPSPTSEGGEGIVKRHWDEQGLAEHWSLGLGEWEMLTNRTDRSRLGFAVLLKFFQIEGRFPAIGVRCRSGLDYLADQLEVCREAFSQYDLAGRSGKRDRELIRSALGFRRATVADAKGLTQWLRRDVLTLDHKHEHLQQAALDWCRRNRIEPPPPARLERIIRSALKTYEDGFFAASSARIPTGCRCAMDALLQAPESGPEATPFCELRADPGRASLESVLNEIAKLRRIVALGLPEDLFAGVSPRGTPEVPPEGRLRAAEGIAHASRADPLHPDGGLLLAEAGGDHRRPGRSSDPGRSPHRRPRRTQGKPSPNPYVH